MQIATRLAIVAALALLLSGCGGSDDETTGTATTPESAAATTRAVRAEWEHNPDCRRPAGASRWGCSVGSYRCQAVVVDRGWSVSCSRPGDSVAFTVRP
jgi:type IV pilus biogenesis protein CpaD/CtpE